eukprot:m.168185 g.168185  ORF g.168185 m.168185 type:complete len:495 (-) comp31500_c0_seq1:298-1782(-)
MVASTTPATTSPKKKDAKSEEVEEPKLSPEELAWNGLRETLELVARGIQSDDGRFILRSLRSIPKLRKSLSASVLRKGLNLALKGSDRLEEILKHIEDTSMEIDSEGATPKKGDLVVSSIEEAQLFAQMITVIFLIDAKKITEAIEVATAMIAQIVDTRLRSVSSQGITAKCYYYFALAHELQNTDNTIRPALFAALRTSTLRSDETSQAVLLNLLLRNFLRHNLIDQAMRLIAKTVFPTDSAPNNEAARYLYYLGRIQAVQLDYSASHENLELAIRKAPRSAVGFLQHVTKLSVIVKMLLGEIPQRDVFGQKDLRKSLSPYFQLTQAVRNGDLSRFGAVVAEHTKTFRADKNYTLILRLRHNVIKAGVRMINISYSRIALSEIAQKLQLDSAEDAEYIVAKAIRDGVIDASINHAEGCVQSNETLDVYNSTAPQMAFHTRIKFCMDTYNESIKGMRYPPNAYRRYLESAEDSQKREQEEKEIAAEIDEMDEGW